MKYFVYLIINHYKKRLISYVGYTENVKKRLKLHNSSKGAKFTRGRKWKIIYKKSYNSKSEAMKNEYLLISIYSKRLISYVGYTNNIKKRLKLHNSSKGAKFTRGKKWKIIYKKGYNNKSEAMKNEYLLKKK